MKYACLTCGAPSELRYCTTHRGSTKTGRPSFKERGYGKEFGRNRRKLLASKPTCCVEGCLEPATVADHEPPRRLLVAMQVENADALIHLQPMCRYHHHQKTGSGR